MKELSKERKTEVVNSMTMSNKAPRLVFHVGPHKTASSYLQENFKNAGAELSSRGWLYPRFETSPEESAHHELAHNPSDFLAPDSAQRRSIENIGKESETHGKSILFSAEGFCRWQPAQFEQLADILGFESYEIVYVVRDPLDLFVSFWAEEVKQGIPASFADRFAREFGDPLRSRFINSLLDLAPLLARPRAHIRTISYDTLASLKEDIFGHFTKSILYLDGLTPGHRQPVNVKYTIEVTEFLRLITLIHAGEAKNIGPELRLKFMNRTTPADRLKLARLLKEKGQAARRVIKVPGDASFMRRIQTQLSTHLQQNWTMPLPEDEPIFRADERKFVYYDSYLLATNPFIRKAADDMLANLKV